MNWQWMFLFFDSKEEVTKRCDEMAHNIPSPYNPTSVLAKTCIIHHVNNIDGLFTPPAIPGRFAMHFRPVYRRLAFWQFPIRARYHPVS